MAEKNIQIKNLAGDDLFPKTKGAVVINNTGGNLGDVEAGAQVNIIEAIQVNGSPVAPSGKTVNITIPADAQYAIAKLPTATEGYAASYQLQKDGAPAGVNIDIPKDMVVQSGSVKTCETADQPVEGLAVGDPYIDLLIANADDQHIYIPVKDLVDVYTAADNTITITGNTIKVNLTELQKTFYTETEIDTKLEGYQAKLNAGQLEAVNSGITAAKVATYDGYAAQIAAKADDAAVVHLANEETITGKKTFSAGLANGATIGQDDNSTAVPTTAWVTTKIAGFLTYEEIV